MKFPGLRQFHGAVTLRLARYVCACGTVRYKADLDRSARPADKTGSRRWQRRRGAARGRNSRAGVGAVVCLLRERGDARSKSRAPQPGAALRFLQAPAVALRKNRLSARGKSSGSLPASVPKKSIKEKSLLLVWGQGFFVGTYMVWVEKTGSSSHSTG